MSSERVSDRPRILLKDIAAGTSVTADSLLIFLMELENRGLIAIHKTNVVSVSLTNYGIDQENPLGGFHSE